MDELIKHLLQGENEILWYETTSVPPVSPSASRPYPKTPRIELQLETAGCNNGVNSGNINKRLIEVLRKISWVSATVAKDDQKQRCFRHMIMEWLKDLESRNYELQANLGANNDGTKIRVRIDNPTYGIDSMLEVLKCLKTLDSKPRMIQFKFTNQEFLAVLDLATEMRAADVEKAVNRTLQEAERMLEERWTG